jgi:hypothetical protein
MPMTKNTSTKAPAQKVTPAELKKLDELESAYKEATALRSDIRDRVLAGAKIEPGTLEVDIESTKHRRVTHDSLAELFSISAASAIINAIPRTTSQRMLIRQSQPMQVQTATAKEAFNPYLNDEDGDLEEYPRMDLERLLGLLEEETQKQRRKNGQAPTDMSSLKQAKKSGGMFLHLVPKVKNVRKKSSPVGSNTKPSGPSRRRRNKPSS